MYYFIGINGEKMSALAAILYDLGYEVMGSSDKLDYFTLLKLKERNINVKVFSKDNIKENMVIVTSEENLENEEYEFAKKLNLRIFSYQDVVSKLTKMFQTITIMGSYGKTTTSAMMTHVLKNINDINYLIGDGTGFAKKENRQFVIEAADYKQCFVNYTSYYAIITSIDFKHDDYFEDIDDVISAYEKYANNAEKMIIACGDDSYSHSLKVNKPIFYYGLDEDNDILAKNVEYTKDGIVFDVFVEDNYYGHFDLPLYGKHQLMDALAVISVCYYERYEAKVVSKILKTYTNPTRRFVDIEIGTNVVIDDNAFYPIELRSTIKAVKQKYNDKNLIVIFDPHNGLNNSIFKDEFNSVLSQLENVFIFEPKDYQGLDNFNIINLKEAKKLVDYENSVLLFMGSNDILKLEKNYLTLKKELNSKKH